MKNYMYTNQRELRRAFWQSGNYTRKLHNGDYTTDTRCAFCDYIDQMERAGYISPELAQRATLK